MFKRIKEIIELLKLLYIKIAIMCKNDSQIGRDNNNMKTPPPTPSNDDNNNNHIDEHPTTFTSTL